MGEPKTNIDLSTFRDSWLAPWAIKIDATIWTQKEIFNRLSFRCRKSLIKMPLSFVKAYPVRQQKIKAEQKE